MRPSSSSSSNQNEPTDFHHLTARFKIPLAPSFLTKPTPRNTTATKRTPLKGAEDEEKEEDEKNGEEEDNVTKEYGNSGTLEAINQSLASLLMKYIPSLGSVLVSYLEPPMFLRTDQEGKLIKIPALKSSRLQVPTLPGYGWGIIDVEVKLMGWRPTIGHKLIGRPTLSSPSHLSLVIYRTFNASINENHLKAAGFHYDINFEVPAHWKSIGELSNNNNTNKDQEPSLSDLDHKERGCWVDANGVVIGGDEGTVSFTVISLTIANHMISVVGSLLDDPFTIEEPVQVGAETKMAIHTKPRRMSSRPRVIESDSSSDDDESEDERRRGRSKHQPPTIQSSSTTQSKSTLVPPPLLTANNLKALDSALPNSAVTSTQPLPKQKSTKKIKKKGLKRTSEVLEDKPPLNSIPGLSSSTIPVPAPPSTAHSARKKKFKSTLT
ncbi:hypothetical protein PSHT_16563 [Puccinia striiformis]|uniref:RPA43 OB domain-containing protein n=1 Tax=Puccinia striiformis TaxID=27350 RepID=A0A2S4U9C6_9BASI|nr:hypothetical protein PSHT_16563 [Puccinia striiformis]